MGCRWGVPVRPASSKHSSRSGTVDLNLLPGSSCRRRGAYSCSGQPRPGTRKDGVTEPRLSVPSPSLCIRTESVSTAELLLKGAAAGGASDCHLEGLATFRHRLLIRGSLVRSQLGEPFHRV